MSKIVYPDNIEIYPYYEHLICTRKIYLDEQKKSYLNLNMKHNSIFVLNSLVQTPNCTVEHLFSQKLVSIRVVNNKQDITINNKTQAAITRLTHEYIQTHKPYNIVSTVYYDTYTEFMFANNSVPLSQREFAYKLCAQKYKSYKTNGKCYWKNRE